MKGLCIVPCGSRKIWKKEPEAGATQARNVYIGPFARKCIEYAEIFHPSHYRILSAKYGLMEPDFRIPHDYNITFNKPSGHLVSIDRLKEQALESALKGYKEIIILGGREYVWRINAAFDRFVIHTPLATCKGLGYMMQKLTQAIQSGKPLV